MDRAVKTRRRPMKCPNSSAFPPSHPKWDALWDQRPTGRVGHFDLRVGVPNQRHWKPLAVLRKSRKRASTSRQKCWGLAASGALASLHRIDASRLRNAIRSETL